MSMSAARGVVQLNIAGERKARGVAVSLPKREGMYAVGAGWHRDGLRGGF
jgi:hypothetical protein